MKSGKSALKTYLRLWRWHEKRIVPYWLCAAANGLSLYMLSASMGLMLSRVTAIAEGAVSENLVASMIVLALITIAAVAVSGALPAYLRFLQEKTGNGLRSAMLQSRCGVFESEAGKISDSDVFLRMNDDLTMALDAIGIYANGVYFNPIFSGLFSCITISALDWRLGLFTLVFAFAICAPLGAIRKRTAKAQAEIQQSKSRLSQQLSDVVGGAEEIRVFGLENWSFKRVCRWTKRLFQKQIQFFKWSFLRLEWFSLGYFFNLLGLVALGSYLAGRGIIPFSTVMISLPLSGQVMQMVQGFGSLWAFICERETPISRVFEILDTPQEKIEPTQAETVPTGKDISFDSVSFSYDASTPVLKNVSFKIKSGQSAAFVGESGSGKSTILRLLMGFYPPSHGKILAGESQLDFNNLAEWRRQFAYIQQDTSLFNLSARDNISFASGASDSDIKSAASLAGADEFINAMDGGYAQSVGEGGKSLSGGQRQRVAIARGLVSRAPAILMDEPTSALDTGAEELLRQTVLNLHAKRTLIMISHKLAFSADCDEIYFMSDGQIVEHGTHAELLEKRGGYFALWNAQTNGDMPS